jgi:hypothetical protein
MAGMGQNLLVIASCLVCVSAAAQQGGVSATVPSGVKTQIATHDRFDKQCRPNRVEISVIAPPANGTVSTEPKDIVVKAQNRYGDTQPSQCVGKTVAGVAIFYQSKPGFVGTDSFRYRRSNPDDANDRFNMEILYRVTVQ